MHKDKREAAIKGRGPVGKAIVAGLLERTPDKDGCSKMKATVVADRSAETLQAQVRASVEAGSEIMTDESVGYEGLDADYIHSVINHSIKYAEGNIHMNSAENFWTLFKRCINGTYVSVECDHLPAYLDEETFRFNEREGKDKDRFVKALQGIAGRRIMYRQLIDSGDEFVPRRGELRKRKWKR
jgi:hypothetical protein